MTNQADGPIRRLAPKHLPVANRIIFSGQRGARLRFGAFLLAASIVLLPLQDHLPGVAGFSIIYIMFGVVGFYVLMRRLDALIKVSTHPVFLAGYALLSVCFVMESVHSNSDYSELIRYGSMIAGALLVAALCSEAGALRAGMYGYLIAGIWLSLFLLLTSYGALRGSHAVDFEEASRLRATVFSETSLRANLNTMAFISSQAVAVGLALMLTAKSLARRLVFMAIALCCFIASFAPMSRSGTAIALVSAAVVMYKYKSNRLRAMGAALVLAAGIWIFVPDAAFSRLRYFTGAREGKMEGRARIYTAAWQSLPEYIMSGVGTGNYSQVWANNHGLGERGRVSGAHNSFFQVTIYWGLPGLVALLGLIWCSYRCLLKQNRDVALTLFLYGTSVSLLLWMMATHNFYAKEFSLGIGFLTGASLRAPRYSRIIRKVRLRVPTDGVSQSALTKKCVA